MCHGTARIILGDLQKLLLGLFVPERVQQCDSAREWLLHRRGAGYGEVNRPELSLVEVFVVVMVFIVIVVGEGREREED